METEVLSIAELSQNLTTLFIPIVAAMMVVFFGLMIRDMVTAFAKGFMFRIKPTFKESDIVFLDGERAIIVKIGLLSSVFGISKPDGTYCWRYIPNTRIEYLKIEKIINLHQMKLPKIDTNPEE